MRRLIVLLPFLPLAACNDQSTLAQSAAQAKTEAFVVRSTTAEPIFAPDCESSECWDFMRGIGYQELALEGVGASGAVGSHAEDRATVDVRVVTKAVVWLPRLSNPANFALTLIANPDLIAGEGGEIPLTGERVWAMNQDEVAAAFTSQIRSVPSSEGCDDPCEEMTVYADLGDLTLVSDFFGIGDRRLTFRLVVENLQDQTIGSIPEFAVTVENFGVVAGG